MNAAESHGGEKGRSDPAKVHSNSDIDRHMQKCKVKKRGKKEQQPELALKVEEKKNPNPPITTNSYCSPSKSAPKWPQE